MRHALCALLSLRGVGPYGPYGPDADSTFDVRRSFFSVGLPHRPPVLRSLQSEEESQVLPFTLSPGPPRNAFKSV